MSKTDLITKSGTKLRATDALRAAVVREFDAGAKLPEVIKKLDEKTGAKTIHLVSPVYWAAEATKLGPIEPTAAAVKAARKAGQRREVVAKRAGISVAEVAKLETAKGAKPIYTGRGTRKHVAAKA